MIENKKILVLGGARSGVAVAKLLGSKNDVLLTDRNILSMEDDAMLKELGVKVHICDNQEDLLDDTYDILIRNPGVLLEHPAIVKANELGISVTNEMEVAYGYLPESTYIIGITGSNGKTTTTTIVYEILSKICDNVVLGGNIGIPLSEIAYDLKPNSTLVLEISDHQLVNFEKFKTNISLLTNLCETHLDFHGSYEKYKAAKRRIFNNHDREDYALINFKNSDSLEVTNNVTSTREYFQNEENYIGQDGIYINKELIVSFSDIKLVGQHNYENILSALMILKHFRLDKEVIKEFLNNFNGVAHRLEYVTEKNGVKFYNDSKATNPTSTITALKTFNTGIHLLLGGMERNQDFNELNEYMTNVKCIYAFGDLTDRIYEYATENNFNVVKCYDIATAVKFINAKINEMSGDVVLLSPASASWDQYKKFEDRGDEFKNLVM